MGLAVGLLAILLFIQSELANLEFEMRFLQISIHPIKIMINKY